MARRKVVLTAGAFDILHPGHFKLLEKAKEVGGRGSKLVVVVARDETVRRNKGREPVFEEKLRKYMVSMIKPVDEVILGYRPFSFEKVIKRVKPDIVVFGYDQERLMESFKKFCEEKGVIVKIVRLRDYRFSGPDSSSNVIERVLEVVKRRRRS